MGISPVVGIIIVVFTLTFQGLLFGTEIAERSFPDLIRPEHDSLECDGFFDGFVCAFENVIAFIANIFIVLFGAIVFLYNMITFNVPGAPWFVRVPLGAIMFGLLAWPALVFFRRGS